MNRWNIVALIALLSLIALGARHRLISVSSQPGGLAGARACQANLGRIATGMEMYATDHSGQYPKTLSELVPRYLPAIPSCPSTHNDTYTTGFQVGPEAPTNLQGGKEFFYIACSGKHHVSEGLEENLPAFSCTAGLLPELPFEGDAQEARQACEKNLRNIATALEMHAHDWQGKYPELLSVLTPDYLHKIPNCPVTGTDSYSSSYQVTNNPGQWTVFCSDRHGGSKPGYDSMRGAISE